MSDDPRSGRNGEEGDEEDPTRPEESGSGDESGSDDEERKPISVRDLMPPSASEGRRRAPVRRRPQKPGDGPEEAEEEPADEEPDEEDGEAAGGESSPSRPTPVRVAMDAPPPGDSRPTEALPSRRFEARDEEWIVRITGRTMTGTRPDPGALLMHLTFFRAEEPESPVRELLTVNRPLDALYPEDLDEFLERSRPASAPFDGDADGS